MPGATQTLQLHVQPMLVVVDHGTVTTLAVALLNPIGFVVVEVNNRAQRRAAFEPVLEASPGLWILGTPMDDDRRNGMGIVVEYSGKTGSPRWIKPPRTPWDYTQFGPVRAVGPPDETIPMVFGKINGGTGGFQSLDDQRRRLR